jgi:hypothetical protein
MVQAPSQKFISITAAIDLAGLGLFGPVWIGRLTEKEIGTLAALGPRRPKGRLDLPEMIEPVPPKRAASVERAIGRYVHMTAQRNKALDWIYGQGAVVERKGLECDHALIESALASMRIVGKPDGTGNKVGRSRIVSETVILNMLADLQSGAMTVDSLGKAKGEFLAERYNASRGTCVEARKAALREWDARHHSNF